MFQKIVIGVDENDGSHDAIQLARQLASADAKFTLVNVYAPSPNSIKALDPAYYQAPQYPTSGYSVQPYRAATSSPSDDEVSYEGSRRLLERIAHDANLEAGLWAIPSGNPGKGIRHVAESVSADLIVLGSRHGSEKGQVDLNHGTRAVLSGAPCSIAIAPAKYSSEPRIVSSVGVGYDGNPESTHALGFARGIAQDLNAKLVAVEVVDPTEFSFAGRFDFGGIESGAPLLSAIRAEVTAIPGAEGRIEIGIVDVELSRFSETVDLLVLGSRGYGPLGRLIHGSTTLALAHNARCPLLVLTRATRATTAAAEHPSSVVGVGLEA